MLRLQYFVTPSPFATFRSLHQFTIHHSIFFIPSCRFYYVRIFFVHVKTWQTYVNLFCISLHSYQRFMNFHGCTFHSLSLKLLLVLAFVSSRLRARKCVCVRLAYWCHRERISESSEGRFLRASFLCCLFSLRFLPT